MDNKRIHLEVFHEGDHWIPCVYMTRVVDSVASQYSDILIWEKVITKNLAGAQRYQEFSKFLGRPAPLPSIAINGQLVFETIPSTEELKACIDRNINKPILSDQKKRFDDYDTFSFKLS